MPLVSEMAPCGETVTGWDALAYPDEAAVTVADPTAAPLTVKVPVVEP